jgi:hypothetical protein
VPPRPRRAGSSAGGPVNRYQKLARWNRWRDESGIVPMGSRKRDGQEKALFDAARPVDPDGLDFAR